MDSGTRVGLNPSSANYELAALGQARDLSVPVSLTCKIRKILPVTNSDDCFEDYRQSIRMLSSTQEALQKRWSYWYSWTYVSSNDVG